jgi:hypothetical protein
LKIIILIDFNGAVNPADKPIGTGEPHRATHQQQTETKNGAVTEIKCRLKQAIHFRSGEKIINGVQVNVE